MRSVGDGHYETHVPREIRMAQRTVRMGGTRSAHQVVSDPTKLGQLNAEPREA